MTDWCAVARRRGRPAVMGILNVTPDSFSDGGIYSDPSDALAHALRMVDEGADIIDIGGESTHPGSEPISLEEELARVVPVVAELAPLIDIPISIDTMKAPVAEACINAGARIINDVYGLRGEGMMDVAAENGVQAVIMFMHGTPKTLASDTVRGDILPTVKCFLDSRTEAALDAGMSKKNIILDPGVGFGMTHAQSMEIIENCSYFGKDHAILIGASRKRFLSEAFPSLDREAASAEAARTAYKSGAHIVRVHDVSSAISFR
jgi:dihydropteroate synthase